MVLTVSLKTLQKLALKTKAQVSHPEAVRAELAQPLEGGSTWELGAHALPGQHSGASSGGVGVGELALRAWAAIRKARQESFLCFLRVAALDGLAGAVLESSSWWCGQGRVGRLTSSAIIQAQVQGFETSHPKSISSVNCW